MRSCEGRPVHRSGAAQKSCEDLSKSCVSIRGRIQDGRNGPGETNVCFLIYDQLSMACIFMSGHKGVATPLPSAVMQCSNTAWRRMVHLGSFGRTELRTNQDIGKSYLSTNLSSTTGRIRTYFSSKMLCKQRGPVGSSAHAALGKCSYARLLIF